ncbi:hypothetical protein PGB90_009656 [Kerria lacca]
MVRAIYGSSLVKGRTRNIYKYFSDFHCLSMANIKNYQNFQRFTVFILLILFHMLFHKCFVCNVKILKNRKIKKNPDMFEFNLFY